MTQLNKLLIQQADIFLAPGRYFHREFNGIFYHQLPSVLQKRHNQQLIQQYALPLPDEKTPLLPKILARHWKLLPNVALGLGMILHPDPLPWWGQLPQYKALRTRFNHPIWQVGSQNVVTPQTLLALGVEQLLTCLAPFGSAYAIRVQYMFNSTTQQLIAASPKMVLPWNIIEETCHYVRKNTVRENAA